MCEIIFINQKIYKNIFIKSRDSLDKDYSESNNNNNHLKIIHSYCDLTML